MVTGLVGIASAAFAFFTDSVGTTSNAFSTTTLQPPTGTSAANGICVVLTSTAVTVSWTATTSTFADGYQIFRSTTSGGPYTSIGTVSGRTTTTFSDTTPAFNTTYYYVVQATKGSWRSANSNQASVKTPRRTTCT